MDGPKPEALPREKTTDLMAHAMNRYVDRQLQEFVEQREARELEKKQKMDGIWNREVLPLENRLGKEVCLSNVCFTNDGKLMLKRPKKEVVKRAMTRVASESTLQIQFHYQTE